MFCSARQQSAVRYEPRSTKISKVGPRRRLSAPCRRSFWRDRDGGTLVLFALSLPVVVAMTAIAIDFTRAIAMRQSLSMTADLAVLAAASHLPDAGAARKAALRLVEMNLPEAKFGKALKASDIEVGHWEVASNRFVPSSGKDSDDAASAVRVTVRLAEANKNALTMPFTSILGSDSIDISVSAVAGRGGPPCVMALDPLMSPSMVLDSNAVMETIGCTVQVNSTSEPALRIDSNGTLLATDICVGGTAQTPTSGTVSPEPREYCPGRSDPMAGLEPPVYGACEFFNARYVDSSRTLDPGTYCGGLEIDGNSNVTFSPGTYVIEDGPFNILGNSFVTGSAVTIFLTGANSVLFFDSNASLEMTAPTSGKFQGVLMFQDRESGGFHRWNGNSTASLRGVIYLPSGTLVSENVNNITPLHSCTVLITQAFEFNADSGVSIDITRSNCRGALPRPYNRGIVLLQ